MNSMLNIAAFCCGTATAYFAINACNIIARKERTRLRLMLGFIFAYWAVMTGKDLVSLFPGAYTGPMLDAIQVADGWGEIVLACLLFELSSPGWVTLRRVALLSLPFAAFTAAYIVRPTPFVAMAYLLFLIAAGAWVLRTGYKRMLAYKQFLRDNYSNIDGIDIAWLKNVYFAIYLCMLFWIITAVVRHPIIDSLSYVSSIVLWQAMLHFCAGMKAARPVPANDPAPGQPAADAKDYTFASAIDELMERERLYLDPKLTLGQLAERVGTNRTYLSNYFNGTKGMAFYDYVNSLRITNMSLPLMDSHPEYSLERVAELSGFNSVSTFRRAFAKVAGTTPGRYSARANKPADR